MVQTKVFNTTNKPNLKEKESLIDFLFDNLQEYGDPKSYIEKALMQETIDLAKGSIALHVEPENPARFLYEKVGFSSKYIEMRYKHSEQNN